MMPDPETTDTISDSLARTYTHVHTRVSNVLYDMFTEHPHAQRLSYCQHFVRAARAALHTGRASLSFAIHSVFPFLFQKTGSTIVHQLHQESIYEKAVLDSKEEVDRIIRGAFTPKEYTSLEDEPCTSQALEDEVERALATDGKKDN